ncbi:MAG: 3-isopropylmalate/(R)-2-methylmalate dehydratase small subunit [Candidatus Azotimanducaceae bacterium]|jgi:3-isopropylmalate/(R)-2-methylmalate dehydratase small subunit
MSLAKISGRGVYVQGNDIDTDRIIPARFLKCVTFDELGPSLFYDVRFNEDGTSKNHVLDAVQFQGAEVLVSDGNFGCGSSREHAPQAIQKFGMKAVIAGSFAEIFQGNCTTLGIPCAVMDDENRAKLSATIESDPDAELIIDLEAMQVVFANRIFPISMKESTREAFLSATYDPLDNLLSSADQVKQTAQRLGYA